MQRFELELYVRGTSAHARAGANAAKVPGLTPMQAAVKVSDGSGTTQVIQLRVSKTALATALISMVRVGLCSSPG